MQGLSVSTSPQVATSEFIQNLEDFCKLVSNYNFSVRPYSVAALEKFGLMDSAKQESIVKSFEAYKSFFAQAVADRISLRDDVRLLKTFAQKMGLILHDSVYQSFSAGDVIEVYTMDNIQMYRNLAFMEMCSYTLLDLLTYEPWELYERSDKITQMMYEAASKVPHHPIENGGMNVSYLPKHLLRERFSEERLTSLVGFKWMFPIYRWPQQLYGLLLIQSGEPVLSQEAQMDFI